MAHDSVVFRAGDDERRMVLSIRDVHLLDGASFVARHGQFRDLLALDFVRGLRVPPEGQVLATHPREVLVARLTQLLGALEQQRGLISFSYGFRFSEKPAFSGGGAVSGFMVRGLHGSVSARPAGYCDVKLRGSGPGIVELIDLRAAGRLQTDDWGVLTVTRRKSEVGWFTQLPAVIDWLSGVSPAAIQVLHE
jgi:hypothetical protein